MPSTGNHSGIPFSRVAPCGSEDAITVLVVEDSRSIRQQLGHLLRQMGKVEVVEAGTLAEATALLEAGGQPFFCAVLDLTLPDARDGEIVGIVQRFGVPSIVLTASSNPLLRAAMRERQVIDYVYKTGMNSLEEVASLVGRLRHNCGTTVMVVDDSRTFCDYMGELLTQYRFRILIAGNGKQALALLEQHPDVALIIADYNMPEMDGLEMIRRIRKRYRREDLAIVALSDAQRPDLAVEMLKAGANDYLGKKFQLEEFYCRVARNIDMVHVFRQLHDMANRDGLTQLYNRRYFHQAGDMFHRQAVAEGRGLMLAMVDVDHFKRINDRFGHGAGDDALTRIASVLRATFGDRELLARYGGEEFVCVAAVPPTEPPLQRFEKLRQAIESIEMKVDGQPVPLTVSIGVATHLGPSLTAMIERADAALYRAKAEGRNRVVWGGQIESVDAAGRDRRGNPP